MAADGEVAPRSGAYRSAPRRSRVRRRFSHVGRGPILTASPSMFPNDLIPCGALRTAFSASTLALEPADHPWETLERAESSHLAVLRATHTSAHVRESVLPRVVLLPDSYR